MNAEIAERPAEETEERRRKYWYLSGFYNHVKYMDEYHPGTCQSDLINNYLNNQDAEEKMWRELAAYEAEVLRHNKRLLRAIKKVKGKTFHKYLLSIIDSCDRITDKMVIEKEPGGEWQKETDCGRTIKETWVDQWATGTEGDSWSGYVWVQLKKNKFLKICYSM